MVWRKRERIADAALGQRPTALAGIADCHPSSGLGAQAFVGGKAASACGGENSRVDLTRAEQYFRPEQQRMGTYIAIQGVYYWAEARRSLFEAIERKQRLCAIDAQIGHDFAWIELNENRGWTKRGNKVSKILKRWQHCHREWAPGMGKLQK